MMTDGFVVCLLQTELLSRCQQCERFANTPFPGVRPLGRVNPNDEVTAVGWCQLTKELPGFSIGLYRFRDVIRQVGDDRSGSGGVLSRCSREACGSEQAGCLQFLPPSSIESRPLAGGLSRRHLDRLSVVIQSLDKTVDPSKAQRLTDGVVVRHRLQPRVVLGEMLVVRRGSAIYVIAS